MMQPHFPHQLIIPPLIQEQLMVSPQRRIRLTVLVQIRSMRETAVTRSMREQYHALPHVQEDADAAATLLHVLVAAAFVLVLHAAHSLRAEYVAAEEADGGICDFFAGCRTFAFDCFFGEGVVGLWKAD